MLNICESCGQHSSQTVYEFSTQFELCPRCLYDLLSQPSIRPQNDLQAPQNSHRVA